MSKIDNWVRQRNLPTFVAFHYFNSHIFGKTFNPQLVFQGHLCTFINSVIYHKFYTIKILLSVCVFLLVILVTHKRHFFSKSPLQHFVKIDSSFKTYKIYGLQVQGVPKKRGLVKISNTNITQLFLRNLNVFTNKICLILHKVIISFELSSML